jgi:hypothetical protein
MAVTLDETRTTEHVDPQPYTTATGEEAVEPQPQPSHCTTTSLMPAFHPWAFAEDASVYDQREMAEVGKERGKRIQDHHLPNET